MKLNRRQFLQTSAATLAVAADQTAKAGDPFAPAAPDLTAQWFDKGKQHILPGWAFTITAYAPPSPQAVTTATWEELSGGKDHGKPAKLPFDPDPVEYPGYSEGDKIPVGHVLHGTAVEWNGRIIGGNKKHDGSAWSDAESAWEAMRERVKPDGPSPSYGIDQVGNWGKYGTHVSGKDAPVRCYKVVAKEALFQLRPDAGGSALLYTYAGLIPGPTFRFRQGMPAVVRFENRLQTEMSIHHHGGHNPTHSDGFPGYYVLQGQARDYLYPNILPVRLDESGKTELDFGEGQSTTWYHDHGLDATAFNVAHGLSGFALWFDPLELDLLKKGVLPGLRNVSNTEITISNEEYKEWVAGWQKLWEGRGPLAREWAELMIAAGAVTSEDKLSSYVPNSAHVLEIEKKAVLSSRPFFYHTRAGDTEPGVGTPYFNPYDLPLVLQDRVIDLNSGQIVYDHNGHNGYIGNTMLVNGRAWPVKKVKRRKYRLRFLDGSNSRIFRLRFLDPTTFRLVSNADGTLAPTNIADTTLEDRAMEFLRIGKDSWLWPMPQKRKSLILNMANRADLVVDFKAWYEAARLAGRLTPEGNAEYYLVNTMPQFDGRGPKSKLAEDAGDPAVFPLPFTVDPRNVVVGNMVAAGVLPPEFLAIPPLGGGTELNQPVALMKFVIEPDDGEGPDASIDETTILRPRHPISDEEVMAMREFTFERGKGAWMINGRFYDPTISNASTVVGVKGQRFKVQPGTSPLAAAHGDWVVFIEELKKHTVGTPYQAFWGQLDAPTQAQVTAIPDGDEPPEDLQNVLLEKCAQAEWNLPSLGYAEEWILRNGGGGWWHPIHIHLEGHQLIGYDKDFEADALIGPDGILGAAAQAQMAALPPWPELVGKFGFDLLSAGGAQADLVRDLKEALAGVPILTLANEQVALRTEITGLKLKLTPAQRQALNTDEWFPKPAGAGAPARPPNYAAAVAWFQTFSPRGQRLLGQWILRKFFKDEIAVAPPLVILLQRPSAGAALFPLIRKKFADRLPLLPDGARAVFNALDELRLQWAGEVVGNHDTQVLGPNTIARIRMRFRTWTGPLVFHCHNVEHEDMRMMVNFEATMSGLVSELNVHDPNVAPAPRSHGQDVTDLETNPYAVGELPWQPKDKLPGWQQPPVPGSAVDGFGDPLIKPRENKKG